MGCRRAQKINELSTVLLAFGAVAPLTPKTDHHGPPHHPHMVTSHPVPAVHTPKLGPTPEAKMPARRALLQNKLHPTLQTKFFDVSKLKVLKRTKYGGNIEVGLRSHCCYLLVELDVAIQLNQKDRQRI